MGNGADGSTIPTLVRVAVDGLEARILISDAGPPPTFDDMIAALSAEGVIYGVEVEAIRQAEAGGEREIVAARGLAAIQPRDGRVDLFFRTGPRCLSPNVLENGKVDHHDLASYENVEEGRLLARRTPPVPGVPGINVKGEEIALRVPRDAPLRAGKGCLLSEDGNEVRAAVTGQPALSRGVITVTACLQIAGDVDYGTGNVRFDGSVEILGSVIQTFSVQATGNILVHGGVEGATIDAGGAIEIMGGVRHQSRLVAGGSIKARYIEYSTVECEGHLVLGDHLMFSDVDCGGTIDVRGSVMGGTVRAELAVRAVELGNRRGAPTQISLTPRIRWAARAREAEAEIATIRDMLERRVTDFEAMTLRAELAAATARHMACRRRLETLPPPRVFLSGTIHEGVTITLNLAILKVESDHLATTVYEESGEIRLS